MKNQLQFYLCLFILIALSSCSKENDRYLHQNQSREITGAEYLKSYDTPEIMFHYAEVNNSTQNTDGLIISNGGQVYAYSSSEPMNDLNSVEIRTSTMIDLLSNSVKLDKTVNLNQLINHYKMTRKVSVNSTTKGKGNDVMDVYFVAYDVTYDVEGFGTCSSVGVSSHKYIQKLLKSTKIINTTVHARSIVGWMAKLLDKSAS